MYLMTLGYPRNLLKQMLLQYTCNIYVTEILESTLKTSAIREWVYKVGRS